MWRAVYRQVKRPSTVNHTKNLTKERLEKFKKAIKRRQNNLTVILENVHDHHNISAVLRTCDSVGIKEIFVLYTQPDLTEEHLRLNKRVSSGARRWVNVNFYADVVACFEHVKKNYDKVYSTHLDETPASLYSLDLTQSVALLFGNEHVGVSKEALKYSDGNFIIPQMGLVQSLNISVACAVAVYEAFRQRDNKQMYDENAPMTTQQQQDLLDTFLHRQLNREKGQIAKKIK